MRTHRERCFHLRGKKCSKNDAKRLSMEVATSGLWAPCLVTLWIGSRVYYSTFFVFLDKILFYNAGEYIRAFRQTPLDPLVSLCLGLQYLHLASQRFPRHRHTCVIQVKKIMMIVMTMTITTTMATKMMTTTMTTRTMMMTIAMTTTMSREEVWPSGQRVGLSIRRSRVRVPLWRLAGFVLGRPEFKSSATLVNSQLVASCQLGF